MVSCIYQKQFLIIFGLGYRLKGRPSSASTEKRTVLDRVLEVILNIKKSTGLMNGNSLEIENGHFKEDHLSFI